MAIVIGNVEYGYGNHLPFLRRVAELPACQLATDRLAAAYNYAREQRVIGSGLKVGEGTVNLALKVATPIVTRLPRKIHLPDSSKFY